MSNAYNNVAAAFKFLVEECGFHVVDSDDEYMLLVGGNLRITLTRADRYDENLINIDVADVGEPIERTQYVYGLGLVRALVVDSASVDTQVSELAYFLRTHMAMVQSMFSKENLQETRAALDRLSRELVEKRWPGIYLDQ
jgi:hypothetical protein